MKKPNIIGRDTFYAYVYPKVEVKGTGKTREDLKNLCYQSTSNAQSYCSGLIQADGWEIKNDYPW